MDLKRHDELREPRGSFRCPWCGAQAGQRWFPFVVGYEHKGSSGGSALWGIGREAGDLVLSFCDECHQPIVWHEQNPIWPAQTSSPRPAEGMPSDARADFEEARTVIDRSPRSAAALLRLSLKKLFEHAGRPGEAKIGFLRLPAEDALPPAVRQALRGVRAIGDDAVPPGELDPRDDRESALALFDLVNIVAERLITEPARWRPS